MGAQGAAVDADIRGPVKASEVSGVLWSIVRWPMNNGLHPTRKVPDIDRYVRGLSLSGITVAQWTEQRLVNPWSWVRVPPVIRGYGVYPLRVRPLRPYSSIG